MKMLKSNIRKNNFHIYMPTCMSTRMQKNTRELKYLQIVIALMLANMTRVKRGTLAIFMTS